MSDSVYDAVGGADKSGDARVVVGIDDWCRRVNNMLIWANNVLVNSEDGIVRRIGIAAREMSRLVASKTSRRAKGR